MLSSVPLYTDRDWEREGAPQKPKSEAYRSEARRDLARLIHSASFRRLQGKTQLFPNSDSDFFRNRLTHSIEVAQIAKSIALKLNSECEELQQQPIDLDLVEFAALAHDLGHPPFGHIGEEALDECMASLGGFEGNAQTLRILTRLEKRDLAGGQRFEEGRPVQPIIDGQDMRLGLNITYRSMASILKYDSEIPSNRAPAGTHKGYYYFDADLVRRIKRAVLGGAEVSGSFRTLECSIMDVADDIAYSTYDVEDAFKANILSPLGILRLTRDDRILESVASKVRDRLVRFGYSSERRQEFTKKEVARILVEQFMDLFKISADQKSELEHIDDAIVAATFAAQYGESSDLLACNGYYRTHYTSQLVQNALDGIEFQFNAEFPPLSSVRLKEDVFCQIEVMKNFTYEVVIRSPKLKIVEFRGKKIIRDMHDALSDEAGKHLLPGDHRHILEAVRDPAQKSRIVCDFIAGMTDRFALEFYERIFGTSPSTVYKPI
jgi:dGTPase